MSTVLVLTSSALGVHLFQTNSCRMPSPSCVCRILTFALSRAIWAQPDPPSDRRVRHCAARSRTRKCRAGSRSSAL